MDVPRFTGFEILETMPQGAMGTVYKARQISLDRIVALKMLPPDLAADSVDLDRFLTEAKLTASLKHPNIVQVYDFGKSEDGIYYFVMEFVSGYSMGEWIRRKQLLSEESSLLVAQSVAGALGYAWEKNRVIHCDIKPDNIMIDGDGTVKVTDLGLAKSVRSIVDRAKTATGMVFGTPNYISPEQSRGDVELDFRTDVYSLGAMLYHSMTGRMPFEGEPLLKVMDRQITDQIPDPQDVNSSISTESACLIEKMMAKDRGERQQNWQSVSEDILRVMSHQMPADELPGDGRSTIRRSAERGKRPHVVVKAAPKVRSDSSREYKDSTAFEDMERKFEQRQKRVAPRPEWWVAGAIGVAVLVLGVLVLRSVSTRRGSEPVQGPDPTGTDLPVVKPMAPSVDAHVEEMKPDRDMQDRENNAKEMFDFAMKWAEAHPAQYDEAVVNFQKVATETRGTKYSLMAVAEIQRIRYVKAKAVNDVLNTLGEQADGMARDKKFLAAAELYEQYQGAFADETVAARGLRAQEWRDMEKAFREEQSLTDERWQTLIQDVSAALVSGDPQAALARVRRSGKDAALATMESELNGLEAVLSDAAQMDRRILDSFRAQKDQEVMLMLANGPEKLMIRDVQGDRVQAEKVVVVGAGHVSQPRTIGVPDLALAEKRLRLGSADAPEIALMNGLLLAQEGDLESAETFFAKSGVALSVPLVAEIRKRQELRVEENARQTLSWLMRAMQIDVPENIPGCEACLAAIRRKAFAREDAKALAKAVDGYRKKFGHTKFAEEYEPVLTKLASNDLYRDQWIVQLAGGMRLTRSQRMLLEKGRDGKICGNCDDMFSLYLNDEQLMDGGRLPTARNVLLRPGDILKVRATNSEGRAGFALIFTSGPRVSFSTGRLGWYQYQPKDKEKWWDVRDLNKGDLSKCYPGSNQGWRRYVESVVGRPCRESIWGSDESNAYLLKVVSYEDLMEKNSR